MSPYEFWQSEVQRIGDAVGLSGRFLVDYGTDHIIAAFRDSDGDLKRAIEMLWVAAKYIREHCEDGEIFYDGTLCDGACVAEDCDIAALMLGDHLKVTGEQNADGNG